jgi:glycosyltransferase involved in cell wall biosynthesis
MKNIIDISIIIPVFNVEPYLVKCFDSVINQTHKNIEVIIIYDNSFDNSLKICKQYIDSNGFILIYGENKGAGAARNYGFKLSKGKFICYLDSDDWIEPTLCSEVLSVIDATDADFVNYGFDFRSVNNNIINIKNKFSKSVMQGEEIFRNAMLDNDIYSVPWNKMYRKSFLLENELFFPEVKEWEDVLYSRRVSYYSNKTIFISNIYYHALVRIDSRSRDISARFLSNGFLLLDMEFNFIQSIPSGQRFFNLYKAHFVKHISFFILKAAFQTESIGEFKKCITLINQSNFNEYSNESEVKALLSIKNRLLLLFCKYPNFLRLISSKFKLIGIVPY